MFARSTVISQVFYAYPLPLSQPAVTTRLAALAVSNIEINGQLNPPQLIHSKCAPHTILSPAYLFKQSITPQNLQYGFTGLKFYNACLQALTPISPDNTLVAFSMRYMTVLNALALQNLTVNNIFSKFNRLLDLRVAIAACAYFGEPPIPLFKNLPSAAKALQYPDEANKKIEYPNILNFIYQKLLASYPKIMNYLLRPRAQLVQTITNPQQAYFVYIDEDNRLCLLRRLSVTQDGRYLKALCLHQSKGIDMKVINLDLAPLIAPLGILTPERQLKLNFDLNQNLHSLAEVNLADFTKEQSQNEALRDKQEKYLQQEATERDLELQNVNSSFINCDTCELAFYDRFVGQLTDEARAIFKHPFGTPLSADELKKIDSLPSELGRLMLFYQYENFPDRCPSDLRARYRTVLDRQTLMREPIIIQECTMLRDTLVSLSLPQANFLSSLLEFFSNCYTR